MSVMLIRTLVGSAVTFASAAFFVHNNRTHARTNLFLLEDMMKRYQFESQLELAKAKTDFARTYLEKRREKDELWYEKETGQQEMWLARPFYKQLFGPPTPDYVN